MKTCSGCKYLNLCDEYLDSCEDRKDVFYCMYRAGRFSPYDAERCDKYRLTDEELYRRAETARKYYAEHPEEIDRLRRQGEELRLNIHKNS